MELHENPFTVMGLSPCDGKSTIMERAEEQSLFEDPARISSAKEALLDMKRRLDAELAWYPPTVSSDGRMLPYYKMNVIMEHIAASATATAMDCLRVGDKVLAAARLYERYIEVEQEDFSSLLHEINRHRRMAHLPEVVAQDLLDHLDLRARAMTDTIKQCLDQFAPEDLINTVTHIVALGTERAEKRAPALIESLMEQYEIETRQFADQQIEHVRVYMAQFRAGAMLDDACLRQNVEDIAAYAKTWQNVLLPLQMYYCSKGQEHAASVAFFGQIREAAILLHNEGGQTVYACRILQRLDAMKALKYLPRREKQIREDILFLSQTSHRWEKPTREEGAGVERSPHDAPTKVFYNADVGGFFSKHRLIISEQGITWSDTLTPLADITGIAWGAVRRWISFIPVRTDYYIRYTTMAGEHRIHLRDKKSYQEIIGHLWKSVGVSILVNMLLALRSGKDIRIGGINFSDTGVILTETGIFSSDTKFFAWYTPLVRYSDDGSFYLEDEARQYSANASYMDDWNTAVLAILLDRFYERRGRSVGRLSVLLD